MDVDDLFDEMYGGAISTTDLGLAAALITTKCKLEKISRDKKGRASFIFSDDDDVQGNWDEYFEGRLQVDARTYFDNIKALKGRIYAGK
ncbi:hypothetical protein HJC99_01210 [Candidatus Saccharibacteria bacterium]|nr:hypothetical protein [Candidatus Saccharibacteria bacterium]